MSNCWAASGSLCALTQPMPKSEFIRIIATDDSRVVQLQVVIRDATTGSLIEQRDYDSGVASTPFFVA
jgi:hypothetical protein